MRLILVAGTTRTAAIDGISAAGKTASLRKHTPSADAEILVYGQPVRTPVIPVSPTGCPTPAVVTRSVRAMLGFDVTVIDAGMETPTAAPTVEIGGVPGRDIRHAEPVPAAADLVSEAREFGRSLPDETIAVGETIPGGTTTALGVLRALGETPAVSSSLPQNPLTLKERVVATGLSASDLDPGAAAGDRVRAVRRMGDPVLGVLAGLVSGALASGTTVTLAGGTQMLAVAALVRHGGIEGDLALSTTSYVATDSTVDLEAAAESFTLDVTVTEPGFPDDHPVGSRFAAGEAKEGVGMGWALERADSTGVLPAVHDRTAGLTSRLTRMSKTTNGF